MKSANIWLMVVGLVLSLNSFSVAQNEAETPSEPIKIEGTGNNIMPDVAADTDDEAEYSYGTVKQVSAEQVSVLEYDYDGEQTVEVVYKITSDTQLENIKAVPELVEGDNVEIYFKREGDNRLVSRLVKENMEEFLEEDSENISDQGSTMEGAGEPSALPEVNEATGTP